MSVAEESWNEYISGKVKEQKKKEKVLRSVSKQSKGWEEQAKPRPPTFKEKVKGGFETFKQGAMKFQDFATKNVGRFDQFTGGFDMFVGSPRTTKKRKSKKKKRKNTYELSYGW